MQPIKVMLLFACVASGLQLNGFGRAIRARRSRIEENIEQDIVEAVENHTRPATDEAQIAPVGSILHQQLSTVSSSSHDHEEPHVEALSVEHAHVHAATTDTDTPTDTSPAALRYT